MLSEKLSEAIAELRKTKAVTYPTYVGHYTIAVILGTAKFVELKAENDAVICFNFPTPRYKFEGYDIVVSPDDNDCFVAIVDTFSGAIFKKRKVKV